MSYQVAVYFDGPRSNWSKKLDPNEVIFIDEVPWLWLARRLARSHIGNTGKCAYVISDSKGIVEQVDAQR